MDPRANREEYELVDWRTGAVVGRLRPDGTVLDASPAIARQVAAAFEREVLVRDGRVVEELGLCFADVETLRPGDPGHWQAVLTHLGALTDVIAQRWDGARGGQRTASGSAA